MMVMRVGEVKVEEDDDDVGLTEKYRDKGKWKGGGDV